MPYRSLFVAVLLTHGSLSAILPVRANDKAFEYEEKQDEISGKKLRQLFLIGEDLESLLVLQTSEGITTLSVMPAKVIFPDNVNAGDREMSVKISFRSTAMDAPMRAEWNMDWMDYKAAYKGVTAEQASSIFGGDSVTVQFDKTAKRYKFLTSGPTCEGLQDAVQKVLAEQPAAAAK